METQRRVARPMGNEAYGVIDMFLGIPDYNAEGHITKYNRIDTFKKEELFVLGERKLKVYLSSNKYGTLNAFINDEVNRARDKQYWFDPQKEKDHYFPLDHYITYLRNDFATDLSAKILRATNWIEVFEAIDVELPLQVEAHVTTTLKQKENFFSKASFKLTCQYLLDFKRKTLFLSDDQKVILIEEMNIKRPAPSSIFNNDDKDGELFYQTTFSAQNNYFDFLMSYKDYLKAKKTGSSLCVGSITYPPEIYDTVKALKPKFDLLTEYADKFKFFVDNDLSPESTVYYTTVDPTKQKLSKNQISIQPQTDAEKIEFNWLFFEFYRDRCREGLRGSKMKYYKALKEGAAKKEHTHILIDQIKNTYEKDKDSPLPASFKLYSIGYLASINGSISDFLKQPTKHNFFAAFCKGYCDEQFRRFLEEELKKLESLTVLAAPSNIIDLSDFEKLLVGINCILQNADWDLVKWQDHFSKERWDEVSFYSNGEMKTASKQWGVYNEEINQFAHESKSKIKHLIIIDGKKDVMLHVKREIDKLYDIVKKFEKENGMFNVDIRVKNHWFSEFWNVVMSYKEWFYELIEPLQVKDAGEVDKKSEKEFDQQKDERSRNGIKEDESENNLSLSSIEDWLYPFKHDKKIKEADYNSLVSALREYFIKGSFPTLNSEIKVFNVAVKEFGWALNQIFRANKTNNEKLPLEYLKFIKQNISIYKNTTLDENNYLRSTMYKYLTTKPKQN